MLMNFYPISYAVTSGSSWDKGGHVVGIWLSEGLWLTERLGEITWMSFRSLVGGLLRKNWTDLAAAELTCDRVVLKHLRGQSYSWYTIWRFVSEEHFEDYLSYV